MTYDDFMCALCIFREARGCTKDEQICVLHVMINRALDPQQRWPHTLAEIVQQPFQFSSFNDDDPNSLRFPTRKIPNDWQAWLNILQVVASPTMADPTFGANHYYSGLTVPYWAKGKVPTLELGPLKFFKL